MKSKIYVEKIVLKPETEIDAFYLDRLTKTETEELEKFVTEVFENTMEERIYAKFKGISVYLEKDKIPLS